MFFFPNKIETVKKDIQNFCLCFFEIHITHIFFRCFQHRTQTDSRTESSLGYRGTERTPTAQRPDMGGFQAGAGPNINRVSHRG